jgi:oligopeptidase B
MDSPEIAGPAAARRPVVATHHGHTRTDDYAWLRADNWQQVMRDPSVLPAEIREHLEAENAWFKAQMADTEALQEQLFGEMRGRIREDDSSVPSPDGPWAYATRYVEGGQHPLHVREKRSGGGEEILLDGNALAAGRAYFRIGGTAHSPDHRLLAWSHDDAGSEFYALSVRNLETGADLADTIPDTGGSAVWSADGRYLFYVRLDDNHRPSRVFRHALATSPEHDVLVYEEPDPGFFVGVGKTQSESFIVIHSHDHETAEARVIPADSPESEPILIAARETGIEYEIDEAHGRFFILTNAGDAKDFRLVTAPVNSPDGKPGPTSCNISPDG